jgi:Tol biopolymer transport system component
MLQFTQKLALLLFLFFSGIIGIIIGLFRVLPPPEWSNMAYVDIYGDVGLIDLHRHYSLHQLAHGTHIQEISWSPIKNQFMWSDGNDSRLYSFDVSRLALVQLDFEGLSPRFSPDGNMIAFLREIDFDDHVEYTLQFMDAHSLQVIPPQLSMQGLNNDFVWSPNSQQIAIVVDGGNYIRDIYLYDFPTASTRLLTGQQMDNRRPTWSPDGQSIAFASYHPYESLVYLSKVEVATGVEHQLVEGIVDFPVWSPDGKQIAFEHFLEEEWINVISVVDADGQHLKRLTPPFFNPDGVQLRVNQPFWSQDGEFVMFFSHETAGLGDKIYLIHPDSTNMHEFSDWQPAFAFRPG